MAEEKKPESSGSESFLLGLFKDTWKTVLKPKGKEILTNMLVDSIYTLADGASNIAQKGVWKGMSPSGQITRGRPANTGYSSRFQQVNGQNQNKQPQNIGMRSSAKLQYVVLPDRTTADKLAAYLTQSISKYGRVTVAAYYEKYNDMIEEMVQLYPARYENNPPKPISPIFNDYEFGWTKTADIHYIQNRDGIVFNLPTPEKIERM